MQVHLEKSKDLEIHSITRLNKFQSGALERENGGFSFFGFFLIFLTFWKDYVIPDKKTKKNRLPNAAIKKKQGVKNEHFGLNLWTL